MYTKTDTETDNGLDEDNIKIPNNILIDIKKVFVYTSGLALCH